MTTDEPNRADLGRDPSRVSGMFDQVAPGYDRTNTVMTFGNDALWRAATTRAASLIAIVNLYKAMGGGWVKKADDLTKGAVPVEKTKNEEPPKEE